MSGIFFADPISLTSAQRRQEMGAKGANLWEMSQMGLEVPGGFVIPASVCRSFYQGKIGFEYLKETLQRLEKEEEKALGSSDNPLFVSVRSTAPVSMPGMMDSLLNVGINTHNVDAHPLGWVLYTQFFKAYSRLVHHIPAHCFPEVCGSLQDAQEFEKIFTENTGEKFPSDPFEVLVNSFRAVLASWNNARAVAYRKRHQMMQKDLYPAVIVQKMVFGNDLQDSGTGVLFTRNPDTGEHCLFGEYLPQCQGEELVAGTKTPLPLSVLRQEMPTVYLQLEDRALLLEQHFKDVQDVEFTIQKGKLWLLQTRSAQRTGVAALKWAYDFVSEGIWSKEHALSQLKVQDIQSSLYPSLIPGPALSYLASGLATSCAGASGLLVGSTEVCMAMAEAGKPVILACKETSCEDVQAMMVAQGIVTAKGGSTCHAAVVARSLGKPCVTGVESLQLSDQGVWFDQQFVPFGQFISLEGQTGRIFLGQGQLERQSRDHVFGHILNWAKERSLFSVFANADTVEQWKNAKEFGALGIGLCRSEHMFFQPTHLPFFQSVILGDQQYVSVIQDLQKQDYKSLLKELKGQRLTVRLLDPPLHEFLPKSEAELEVLASFMKKDVESLKKQVSSLKEINPMLGQRGCRVAFLNPNLYDLQIRALFFAMKEALQEGSDVNLGIMVPFVTVPLEFVSLKERIFRIAEEILPSEVFSSKSLSCGVQDQGRWDVGLMIEVPSAALQADVLARDADFICFGTNDLTQMTLGFSRDDTVGLLQRYQDQGFLSTDPFKTLHQSSVMLLLEIACRKARDTNPSIHISVCGEHGADEDSLRIFHQLGIDSVSCSPFRVPEAYLAASKVKI